MRSFTIILLFSAIGACSQNPSQQPDTFDFLIGEKVAELTDKSIEEASGIAASRTNPGFLWTHNDSGNGAEVFLVDTKMNIRLTCVLKGIDNRDWEDIAVGPGPEKGVNYIYVAEIGDNFAQYTYKYIYRFREPDLKNVKKDVLIVDKYDVITFKLDTRKDTETLLVDPGTKDLFVVSKRESPVVVYKLKYPYSTKDTLTAEIVGKIETSQIVGGDISVSGNEIVLKNYSNVFYWKRAEKESVEKALQRPPKTLPYTEEPQGEAVTFAIDGSGYYTISEIVRGEKSFLTFYKRKPK